MSYAPLVKSTKTYRGTTYDFSITIKEDGTALDLTTLSKVQVKMFNQGQTVFDYNNTTEGSLTISGSNNETVSGTVSASTMDIPLRAFYQELRLHFSDGSEDVYFLLTHVIIDEESGQSQGAHSWEIDIDTTAESVTGGFASSLARTLDAANEAEGYAANLNRAGISSGDAGKIERIKSDESGWENVEQSKLDPSKLRINSGNRRDTLAIDGGLRLGHREEKPLVSFIDDDAHERVWTYLKPILDDKNVPFGLAVPSNKVGNSGKLTLSQLKTLYSENNCEIISHSYDETGLDSLTDAEIEQQLRDSRQQLEGYGFEVYNYVPVGGQTTGQSGNAHKILDKYYRGSFVTDNVNKYNTKPFIDELEVVRHGFDGQSGLDLAGYKALVDEAINNDAWLIFTTHVGNQNSLYQDADHDTWLPQLIQYIKDQGVDIVTPNDGLDVFGQVFRQGSEKYHEEWFMMESSGKVKMSSGPVQFTRNDKDETTPRSGFLDNHITITAIDTGTNGLPEADFGTLITYKSNESNNDYLWQEWYPKNYNTRYKRTWSDQLGDVWIDWEKEGGPFQFNNDTVDETTTPSEFGSENVAVNIVASADGANFPSVDAGTLITYHPNSGDEDYVWQEWHPYTDNETYTRKWDEVAASWKSWEKVRTDIPDPSIVNYQVDVTQTPTQIRDSISSTNQVIVFYSYQGFEASNNGLPTYGYLVTYLTDSATEYNTRQHFYEHNSNIIKSRYWDDGASVWTSWQQIAGGATGSFTAGSGETITVENGLITSIV